MIQQVASRLKSILARAIIHLVNDENGRQFVQITVLSRETKSNVERIQDFGFTSNPPKGSTAVIGFIGADRSNPVIIGTNDPAHRPKGSKSGESIMYDAFDQSIYLMEDGTILIKANSKVRIEADLEVTGNIIDRVDSDGQSMQDMRSVYNTHIHTGDDGGNTSDPHQSMGGGS